MPALEVFLFCIKTRSNFRLLAYQTTDTLTEHSTTQLVLSSVVDETGLGLTVGNLITLASRETVIRDSSLPSLLG